MCVEQSTVMEQIFHTKTSSLTTAICMYLSSVQSQEGNTKLLSIFCFPARTVGLFSLTVEECCSMTHSGTKWCDKGDQEMIASLTFFFLSILSLSLLPATLRAKCQTAFTQKIIRNGLRCLHGGERAQNTWRMDESRHGNEETSMLHPHKRIINVGIISTHVYTNLVQNEYVTSHCQFQFF